MSMRVFQGSGSRRAAILGVAGALLLLAMIPPCAPLVCPMDEETMAAACHPLDADCCQTQGERAAASPLPTLSLPPFSSPAGSALAALIERAPLPQLSWEEVAAPPILQGLGLHAFLAVFLI